MISIKYDKHPALIFIGIVVIWFFVSMLIDKFFLSGTAFSNAFFLEEGYLSGKPFEIPLPKFGLALFFLVPLILTPIVIAARNRWTKQAFSQAIFFFALCLACIILVMPLLILGEVLYILLIKLLDVYEWTKVVADILNLFSFKAKIRFFHMGNTLNIDMSLGSLVALYIGLPKIINKFRA